MIAPYSARANALGTVSTPLSWAEVTEALDPAAFTIHTVPGRLRTVSDPFGCVLPAPPRFEQRAV
jgi:DNA primase